MVKLIESTIDVYNTYNKKINEKDYNTIVNYLKDKGFILVLSNDNILDDKFVAYVFEVAGYYILEGLIDDVIE